MAAVLPITNATTGSSNALVLPPLSTTTQNPNAIDAAPSDSLVLPPSTTITSGVGATDTTTATPSTTTTTTTTAPALNATTQPLDVVFNALASAGVDTAITQNILAPATAAAPGTFSVFMESLFEALAAQSVAEQAAQANATQSTTATNANGSSTADQTAAAANAFVSNANSAAPNSALESGVQNLAQAVNSQTAVATAVTANVAAQSGDTLTPLQQSFDQFLIDAGGTSTGNASLGGFLEALAANLHTAPTPLGNLVNAQT